MRVVVVGVGSTGPQEPMVVAKRSTFDQPNPPEEREWTESGP